MKLKKFHSQLNKKSVMVIKGLIEVFFPRAAKDTPRKICVVFFFSCLLTINSISVHRASVD